MDIYTEFYNIIADIIRWLEDNTDSRFYIEFRGLSFNAGEDLNKRLEAHLPELFIEGTGQAKEIIDTELYDESFFDKLNDLINFNKHKRGRRILVRLIQKLDLALSRRIWERGSATDETIILNSLNINVNDNNIVLLPRCKCKWERNSRGKQYGNGLMNHLNSLYYIKTEQLAGFSLTNIVMKASFLNLAKIREKITVGISPLTKEDVLDISFYERDETLYFSVNELKNMDMLTNKISDILEEAKKKNVDILLFPEMTGGKEIIRKINELYEEDWDKMYPALVVLPSIWENNTNTSLALDDEGNEIGGQQKQHPFFFYSKNHKADAIEDLKCDKNILLLHAEGIGRIAIMICRDFLERSYRRIILDTLKVNFILSPSFSTGYYDFLKVMEECNQYDCGVLWTNCCAAMNLDGAKKKNFDNIGYLQMSGKHSKDVGLVCMEQNNPCDKQHCKKTCLFTYEFVF